MSGPRKPPAGMDRATRAMFTRIISALARSLRDDELSVAQAAALHIIDDRGEVAIGAVAEELALGMSTASRLIDDLVQRGWVMRSESPDDRRVRLLRLTRAGAAFIQRASDDRVQLLLRVVPSIMPAPIMRMVFKSVAKRFGAGQPIPS